MCVHKLSREFTFDGNYDTDDCMYEDLTRNIECDSSDLSIIQLNIRGLSSKLGDLNYILNNSFKNRHPDVVLLCETWLSKNSPKPTISGYSIERTDRSGKKGGGVCILISTRCNYKRRKDLEQSNTACFESCFIELDNWKSNLIIGSVYRPPNTNPSEFTQKFETITKTCASEKKRCILGLDHNLDLLKCSQHAATQTFLEATYDLGLIPLITKPTRITATTATLIDNIFVDRKLEVESKGGILLDNTSDHLPCYALISNLYPTRRKQLEIKSRDIRPKNIAALKTYLHLPGKLLPLIGNNASEQFDNFHDCLRDAIDHFLPLQTRKIPTRSIRREAWITAGILTSIRKNKRLYKSMLKERNNESLRMKYHDYNNTLQRIKRRAKEQFYYERCVTHKNNTSKLWKTVNQVIHKTNNKSEVVEKLKINNLYEYRGKFISEEFARYFASIGKEYATRIPKPNKEFSHYLNQIQISQASIFLMPVTVSEIIKHINDLKPKKSSGIDEINNVLIKELRDTICEPLLIIFNNSLTEGLFPARMKTSKVVPLYKASNRDETTNYRPISLLLTISKILEKIMYIRIYKFLTDTNQLYISQYGFRKHHSCDQAVGELVSVITKGIEQKKLTAGVFLDLSKAFDSLELGAVFMKMERYGLRGCCLDWFKSYLSDRSLCVSCKTADTGSPTTSSCYDVNYGTPQGSVLGPLIFLIFCNDLHLHLIFLACIQFADDTTLYISHTNLNYIQFCLEHDLRILQDWFQANKLTLNVSKSVVILFGKHCDNKVNIHIGNEVIPQTKNTKFLGLWIDENLNWREHVSKLLLKLKRNLNLLRVGRNFLSPHALRIIYYAQIHSNLTYGIGIWGSLISKELLNNLQKIQNCCIKLMSTGKHKCQNWDQRILTVEQLIELDMCKLWHKKTLGLLPPNLCTAMDTDQLNRSLMKAHAYHTRQKKLLNRPKSTHHLYHDSFLVKGNRLYSQLSQDLRGLKSMGQFSRQLKKKILQNS